MRLAGALIFALLATAALLALPYWMAVPDVRRFAPADELALTQHFVDDVRARNFAAAAAIMDRKYRPQKPDDLAKLATPFPAGRVERLTVLSWTTFGGDRWGILTRLETFYDFGADGAVQCRFLLIRDPAGLKVGGVNFLAVAGAAVHGNDFRLPESWADLRWIYLGVAALADVFALATFALCLMAGVVRWRWRWLWLIAVLVGGVRFNLDWVSLLSNLTPAMVLLPPAGFYRFMAFGPWVLSISAPVGAMVYWAMRAQWRSEAAGVTDIRSA